MPFSTHRVLVLLFLALAPVSTLSYAKDLPLSGRIRFYETERTLNGVSVGELEAEVLGWMQHHRFSTFPLVEGGHFERGKVYRYSISNRSLVERYATNKGESVDALSKGSAYLYDLFHHKNWKDVFDNDVDEQSQIVDAAILQEAFHVLESKGGIDPELMESNPFLRQILVRFESLDEARKNAHFNDTRVRILNIRDRKKVIQSFPVWVPLPEPVEPAVGFLPRVLGFGRNGPPTAYSGRGGASVPDSGPTVAMMVVSLLAMAFGRRFFR